VLTSTTEIEYLQKEKTENQSPIIQQIDSNIALNDMERNAHSLATHVSPSSSSASLQSNSDVAIETPGSSEASRSLASQLKLLRRNGSQQELEDATTTPIFTAPVLEHAEAVLIEGSTPAFTQYGLLAGLSDVLSREEEETTTSISSGQDPRIFFNTAAPSSTFISAPKDLAKAIRFRAYWRIA